VEEARAAHAAVLASGAIKTAYAQFDEIKSSGIRRARILDRKEARGRRKVIEGSVTKEQRK